MRNSNIGLLIVGFLFLGNIHGALAKCVRPNGNYICAQIEGQYLFRMELASNFYKDSIYYRLNKTPLSNEPDHLAQIGDLAPAWITSPLSFSGVMGMGPDGTFSPLLACTPTTIVRKLVPAAHYSEDNSAERWVFAEDHNSFQYERWLKTGTTIWYCHEEIPLNEDFLRGLDILDAALTAEAPATSVPTLTATSVPTPTHLPTAAPPPPHASSRSTARQKKFVFATDWIKEGDYLRSLMTRNGKTVNDLSRVTGLPMETIEAFVAGRERIDYQTARVLGGYLKGAVHRLCGALTFGSDPQIATIDLGEERKRRLEGEMGKDVQNQSGVAQQAKKRR